MLNARRREAQKKIRGLIVDEWFDVDAKRCVHDRLCNNMGCICRSDMASFEESEASMKRIQCPYCIDAPQGTRRLSRHILSKHPEKVEEWVRGIGERGKIKQ